jgi:1-phosphofructokinase
MVYTVTFNPALDYVMHRKGPLQPGETNRSSEEQICYGGKGINVSYVLGQLGVESTALGFIAGFTGRELERGVRDMGVRTHFITLPEGMTRINVKLKGETETEINAAGPAIDAASAEALMQAIDELREGDLLILSGSIPASMPADTYAVILERIAGRGISFAVDATGELLLKTLSYGPLLIKPNLAELCELFGVEQITREEIFTYARRLQEQGARNVLISLGPEGAALLSEDGKELFSPAASGKPVNTVGAGDSMLAGFLAEYLSSGDAREALLMGIAAGAATAFSPVLGTGEEIRRIREALK